MKALQFTAALLSLAPLASAWPSWMVPLDTLVVRQDDSSSSDKPTQTSAASSAESTSPATKTNLNTAEASGTGTATGTATGTGGKKTTKKTTSKPKSTQFDPQSPAGSIVMMTPSAAMGEQLYKIGDKITFGWNYTNLLATPTAIDVLASCSAISQTYTLTQNMTYNKKGSYTWDTGAYQTSNVATPLAVEQYTLVIYDAESSVSATSDPGYLGTFNNLIFGLYTPRPYTPLDQGWQCASCSGAMSNLDQKALQFALTMGLITVLSFTWFVTGLNVAL